jgi:hypothetical protein
VLFGYVTYKLSDLIECPLIIVKISHLACAPAYVVADITCDKLEDILLPFLTTSTWENSIVTVFVGQFKQSLELMAMILKSKVRVAVRGVVRSTLAVEADGRGQQLPLAVVQPVFAAVQVDPKHVVCGGPGNYREELPLFQRFETKASLVLLPRSAAILS